MFAAAVNSTQRLHHTVVACCMRRDGRRSRRMRIRFLPRLDIRQSFLETRQSQVRERPLAFSPFFFRHRRLADSLQILRRRLEFAVGFHRSQSLRDQRRFSRRRLKSTTSRIAEKRRRVGGGGGRGRGRGGTWLRRADFGQFVSVNVDGGFIGSRDVTEGNRTG